MMPRLRPCDACSRHVLETETRCPFCAAALKPAPPLTAAPKIQPGMSRAQRFAVVAAIAGQAAIGCAKTTDPDDGVAGKGGAGGTTAGTTAGTLSSNAGNVAAAGNGGSGGAGGDISVPVYGAPFFPDAGLAQEDASTDAAVDAGTDADIDAGGFFIPVYGAPIP